MRIKFLLLAIFALIYGSAKLKADQSQYQTFISYIDTLHCISGEAFNDRSFKEAMKYEVAISKLIAEDSALLNRVISNRSDMLLYAAQFQPIDSVWKYSNILLEELSHTEINSSEYKVLQLRTAYFDALREEGNANDSIAEITTFQIKKLYGEKSTEYAEALLLKSVILIRSIPSMLEVDYREQKKISHKKMKVAEKSINQAISIYECLKIPLVNIWPSYALALKETIFFEKMWRWHGHVIRHYISANEMYGIASNVSNGACAQTNSIYRSILNAPDGRSIPDAIDALDNLVEIRCASRGNTSIDARFLFIASALSNVINDIQGAQFFIKRAKLLNSFRSEENNHNDSIFNYLEIEINQNRIRLAQLEKNMPLKGFEEALLTIGSPNYDILKYRQDHSDEYWFAPTLDVHERELNYSNLIRELMVMFSGSPFLNKDLLSRFGLERIKEERWNKHIDYPESKASYIYPAHGEEIYYFDDLNQAIGSPLVSIYDKLERKKDKSFEDYQNLSRCCFYLYNFEKAASSEQGALETLLTNDSKDGNLIMECQKRMTYLMMLDLWYDLWLYSDATRLASIYNGKLEDMMSRRANYLKKHPEVIEKKLEKIIASAQTFSYEAIPYLYSILPNLGNEERLMFWRDFSAWFYSIMPMLTFTPGMEEAIYDVQLFSKGLLLETSKTSTPKQYRWKDISKVLNSDEIAIEFIQSGIGYCAAIIKSDSMKPQIVPLFTQSEYNSLSEDMGLYLSSAGYDLILSPLNISDSISTIYFSPTGILNTIAIESFYDKSGVLASDKWNFVRLSSTKELLSGHKKRDSKYIALYGGLDYNQRIVQDDKYNDTILSKKDGLCSTRYIAPEELRYGVDSLRWSLPEVATIRELYNEKSPLTEISLFTSAAGVEESVYSLQNKMPDIIHFSTHGYYWTEEEREKRTYISFVERANMEDNDPTAQAMLFSGLFLSGANTVLSGEMLPDNTEDGVLTAKELSGLNFSMTDFVALSACQTGLGVLNGDGVFGLQRGFKLAGIKTLLMSLWPVHDKATELLMIEFYRNMLNGDTKNTALNKAKKHIKNYSDEEYDFSDPEYWAGWILLDALN